LSRLALLREIWDMLRERKKWWLLPILLAMALLGALLLLTQNPVLAPFIYTLF